MSWTDILIAIKKGLIASGESVQKIINGTTKVGNADKLDGNDSSYFAPKYCPVFIKQNDAQEGGQISLEKSKSSTLEGNITIDNLDDSLRIFSEGANNKGACLKIAECPSIGLADLLHTYNYSNYALPLSGGTVGILRIARENDAYEGGQLILEKPQLSSVVSDIIIDMNGDNLRMFEGSGTYRGLHVDIAKCFGEVGSEMLHTGNSTKVIVSTTAPADTNAVWIVP